MKKARKIVTFKVTNDHFLLHEILHGAHLSLQAFNEATSNPAYDGLYRRYPGLKSLRDRAEDALAAVYVSAGGIDLNKR
jgi:hypothetical protein